MIYSLDVLSLDQAKSSLHHLSSMMAFAPGTGEVMATHTVGDLEALLQTPASARDSQVVRCESSIPLAAPRVYPFPIHTSARVSVLIDDKNNRLERPMNLSQVSEEEYRHGKHVCPVCWMRCKRPSALRTHLNSHTGATREGHLRRAIVIMLINAAFL